MVPGNRGRVTFASENVPAFIASQRAGRIALAAGGSGSFRLRLEKRIPDCGDAFTSEGWSVRSFRVRGGAAGRLHPRVTGRRRVSLRIAHRRRKVLPRKNRTPLRSTTRDARGTRNHNRRHSPKGRPAGCPERYAPPAVHPPGERQGTGPRRSRAQTRRPATCASSALSPDPS